MRLASYLSQYTARPLGFFVIVASLSLSLSLSPDEAHPRSHPGCHWSCVVVIIGRSVFLEQKGTGP